MHEVRSNDGIDLINGNEQKLHHFKIIMLKLPLPHGVHEKIYSVSIETFGALYF